MKNIHVLPTDKPSRLFDFMTKLILVDKISSDEGNMNRHIYITNSEEIKEGDWVINNLDKLIGKSIRELNSGEIKDKEYSKIILTTDQDLINDGVQAIDDKFIGWFVKNPSCEKVEVNYELGSCLNCEWNHDMCPNTEECLKNTYKIIIPKEELKQETQTLEEAAVKHFNEEIFVEGVTIQYALQEAFIIGAKWQQEQDKNKYSEEEVLELLRKAHFVEQNIDEWFEQFKK